MTEPTLEQGRPLPPEEGVATRWVWVRRTVLAIFCVGLLVAIGAVFTQVIAARVPEQRATLERLIADRTGLAVRFDNVHFAWGMDGTSAVFERVELTDPARGRVRVVAPELRVEFDTWDFLRHQQFSLGHVTLSSPDIHIIGDPEPAPAAAAPRTATTQAPGAAPSDEAALIRRFTGWAELMPVGRIEVEGARVHLYRRGERAARHHFSLSEAQVRRGAHDFNAHGTLLLSQDIGQSLFVSVKLEQLGASRGVSGDLRVIARRVFLDKLPAVSVSGTSLAVSGTSLAARGRGTVDARLSLREGRLHEGQWQVSARELVLPRGSRFDHFTVNGRLSRAVDGFQLEFADLQLTRGARLDRAPRLTARVSFTPGTLRASGITANADRVPFMAAEFLAAALAPRLQGPLDLAGSGWAATAGELRDLRFDSRAGTFTAQVSGATLARAADQASIEDVAARIDLRDGLARLDFDAAQTLRLRLGEAPPRELTLAGALTLRGTQDEDREIDLDALRLSSGDARVAADGEWSGVKQDKPLELQLTRVDRALLGDVLTLLALDTPAHLADVQEGEIAAGTLSVMPSGTQEGKAGIDWLRSRGAVQLAGLATAGADVPRLVAAAGKLEFTLGGSTLRITSGQIEDLRIADARIDWPRRGPPRLRASAEGDVSSPLLRRALEEHGLGKLAGQVSLDAEARGEDELREPAAWRVIARLRDASLALADELPPVQRLSGTVRLAAGELRGLTLAGEWLGGPVGIETRRTAANGVLTANVNGTADTAPLLELLGQPETGGRVEGRIHWIGTLQRRDDNNSPGWRLAVVSNLAGVESRLPAPFDKARARALPVNATLDFDARGLREFAIDSGRDTIRGRVQARQTVARFDVRGVRGELQAGESAPARLTLDQLEVRRSAAVLAAAGAMLRADEDLAVRVAGIRHANRDLGPIEGRLARRAETLEFALDTPAGAVHEINATGRCTTERCRMEFGVDTRELAALLGDARLPVEWPTRILHASGELTWRPEASAEITTALTGHFELETEGADSGHQLMASASLADGIIQLTDVQGLGPAPDQMFHGSGRVSLLARRYDVTVDFEQVSLTASAVPTPARMRLSRAWSALRDSMNRGSWSEPVPARRVQWHGSWD